MTRHKQAAALRWNRFVLKWFFNSIIALHSLVLEPNPAIKLVLSGVEETIFAQLPLLHCKGQMTNLIRVPRQNALISLLDGSQFKRVAVKAFNEIRGLLSPSFSFPLFLVFSTVLTFFSFRFYCG